jgi:sugar lactone lactonase YvrE
VWDPKNTADDAKPIRYLVPPAIGDDGGTVALQSLVFDDDGNLIVTDLFRGRVERWSAASNTKITVLLNAGKPGAYKELARGPDGLVYVTGTDGIYRFAASATAEQLASLTPFFDARQIGERYEHPFSPQSMIFVPTAHLAQSNRAESPTDG